jgi:putative phosphoesterase
VKLFVNNSNIMEERMKIAVLSDIHGNYSAFKAVIADARKHKVTQYIIAGDHIGDGPEPFEVVNEIINMKDCCVIKGNKEEKILGYYFGKYPDWTDCLQTAVMVWTSRQLTEEQVRYLDRLPIQESVEVNGEIKIRVVHGSNRSAAEKIDIGNRERIYEILEEIEEEVLIFGHSHLPKRINHKSKIAINPGSVGMPFNSTGKAEYAILERNGDRWSSELKCIDYDKEDYKKIYIDSGLIEHAGAWAKGSLKGAIQGENVTGQFLEEAYRITRQSGISSHLVPNDIWIELDNKWNWEL